MMHKSTKINSGDRFESHFESILGSATFLCTRRARKNADPQRSYPQEAMTKYMFIRAVDITSVTIRDRLRSRPGDTEVQYFRLRKGPTIFHFSPQPGPTPVPDRCTDEIYGSYLIPGPDPPGGPQIGRTRRRRAT